MMLIPLLLSLSGLILILLAFQICRFDKNLPPGPMQLIFKIDFIRKWLSGIPAPELMQELREVYGPILYTKMGLVNTVLLQDYDHIKEALKHKDWIDRVHYSHFFYQRSFGKVLGVFTSNGESWKEMRQFTVRTLREFGFARGNMEVFIRDEVESLSGDISARIDSGDCSLAMRAYFAVPTLNILLKMVIGDGFKKNDPKLVNLLHIVDEGFKECGLLMPNAMNYHFAAPALAKFLSRFSTTIAGANFKKFNEAGLQVMKEIIDEIRAAGAYKIEPRNFVDTFLKEIDANAGNNKNSQYTDEQLSVVLMDLFFAGAETTSNTLEFALLYMVLNPDVQTRIQQEIDEVLGSRSPACDDKSKMPYIEATILEIHRSASVVPIFPRSPIRDTRIGKYLIPKGTIGVINFYAMNMDPETWKNPFEFKPERFLDSSQTSIINAHKVISFGTGPRACIGEAMSNASLFLFLVTLLQKFNFKVSPDHPVPTIKPVNGLTLSPAPFHCIVQKRH